MAGPIVIVDIPNSTGKTDLFWSTIASTLVFTAYMAMGGGYSGAMGNALADALKGWRLLAGAQAMGKGAWAVRPFFTAMAQFLPLHNYAQSTGMRDAYWLVPWGTVCGYAAFRGARAQPVAFATSTVMGFAVSPKFASIFARVFKDDSSA
ncbi:hypothetical protein FB451DRAFT_371900 [Mycena latifolia]|nr:hypothetical protein FB451DRAFT_371900 [Mycena latifolia]